MKTTELIFSELSKSFLGGLGGELSSLSELEGEIEAVPLKSFKASRVFFKRSSC